MRVSAADHDQQYELDVATGVVRGVRFIESPNCDERPAPSDISAILIHSISLPPGQYGGDAVEAFFCNRLDPSAHEYFAQICDMQVSAHFLICRDGTLSQFVSTHRRAWHAGESRMAGRTRVNDFSVGIELEGTDDTEFDDRQYATLVALTRCLMRAYPEILPERVLGHSDVAPGRKTDPGPGFDWARYRGAITG